MIRFFRRKPKAIKVDRSGEYFRLTGGSAVIPADYFKFGTVLFWASEINLRAPHEGTSTFDHPVRFSIHPDEAPRIRKMLNLPEPVEQDDAA